MTAATNLPKLLSPALKALEKDLLARAKSSGSSCPEARLAKAHRAEP